MRVRVVPRLSMARTTSELTVWLSSYALAGITLQRTHLDEEQLLTKIEENSQDAIVSTLGLHWVNDLPG
jgi:hypothetical protein